MVIIESRLTVVLFYKYIHKSNHYVVYLTVIQSYTSIISQKKKKHYKKKNMDTCYNMYKIKITKGIEKQTQNKFMYIRQMWPNIPVNIRGNIS